MMNINTKTKQQQIKFLAMADIYTVQPPCYCRHFDLPCRPVEKVFEYQRNGVSFVYKMAVEILF